MSEKKTIEVSAAVIKKGDKVFCTQRGYGEYKGWWEFPGGKLEKGETPQQALKREIEEELDTEIKVGELIQTVHYDYGSFYLIMHCFWCSIEKGDLVLEEAMSAKWAGKEEVDSFDWLPADKAILDQVKKGL